MTAPVVCWDIDGTLLTTARAGVYALETAALAMTGQPLDLQGMKTAGLTDVEIARLILNRAGSATPERVREFLRRYEDDLPAALHRRHGQAMPGVREILEALQQEPAWGSMLLTGNTRRGAQAKLAHYGLAAFFDFDQGAFSDGTETRADIALDAVARIRARRPDVALREIVVIGDTPHDIACARAVGVRCLAVATGGYDQEDLRGADHVVPDLSAVDFFRLIQTIAMERD